MVARNDVISASDYNGIRSTVQGALQLSYGQTLDSSDVDGYVQFGLNADKVLASQMENLYLDMQRAWVHQTGSLNTTIAVPLAQHLIGADEALRYNTNTGETTVTADSSNMGLNDLISVANQIANFDPTVTPFPASNFSLELLNAGSSRGTNWGGTGQVQSIYHVFEAEFTSVAEMNSYFNSGGTLRFTAGLTGGTTAKAAEWVSIINAMGTVTFGNSSTSAASGTGYMGYTGLTTSYQDVFFKSGSGAYSVNDIKIEGQLNGTVLRFRVSFNDNYTTNPIITNPDITVDGTITHVCQAYYPDSSFTYDSQTIVAVSVDAPTFTNAILLSQNNTNPPA